MVTPLVAPMVGKLSNCRGDVTEHSMDVNNESQAIPAYYSQLYVHKDSLISCFEELHNTIFAYNDETSLSGYHSLKFYIREYYLLNVDQQSHNPIHTVMRSEEDDEICEVRKITLPFFRSCIRTGAHVKSVQAVINGEADVLCLDENIHLSLSQTEEGREQLSLLRPIPVPYLSQAIDYSRNNEKLNGTVPPICRKFVSNSVLSTKDGRLGPNPLQPVLASNRLSVRLQRRIQEAFLDVCFTFEIRQIIDFQRYVTMDESYYDFVKYMMQQRPIECEEIENVMSEKM